MAAQAVTAAAAGVTSVTCTVEPIADGIRLSAVIAMPRLGAGEAAVLELPDPSVSCCMARSAGTTSSTSTIPKPSP
jgi:hypothetical protein